MQNFNIYWGDAHANTHGGPYDPDRKPSFEQMVRETRSFTDFMPVAYYTSLFPRHALRKRPQDDDRDYQGVMVEVDKPTDQIEKEWAEIEAATAALNQDGAFVTFPGYEWQGNGKWGDHNVFYRTEGNSVCLAPTIDALYAVLSKTEAIAIPHHTSYCPGRRSPDWSHTNTELTPFAEVFSNHGCSETDEEWIGLRRNLHMGPGTQGGTYADALEAGLHLGAIASTDGWYPAAVYGKGLMAVLAEELTRDSLWQAFKARRVYGISGDRIKLDFRLNEAPMGSILGHADKRRIVVKVEGSDALDRVEILRNGRVIHTYCHQGTWDIPSGSQPTRFKLRIEAGWGFRDELPAPDTSWEGVLTVGGGRMLGWEPQWLRGGQTVPRLQGDRAEFKLKGPCNEYHQEGNLFEFESAPDAAVCLHLNGKKIEVPAVELCRGSRILSYREECRALLKELTGIRLSQDERDDACYSLSRKAKLHTCIPQAGFTALVSFEDDQPLAAEANYRVRVEQRNGQRAWSSPIWVRG